MLSRTVTGDESWFLHFQPKSKRATMQRKLLGSSVTKIFLRCLISGSRRKVWDLPSPGILFTVEW